MNKRIKRMIAVILVINTFGMVEPIKYFNLTNIVTANAAINTNLKLKDIYLSKGDINFDSEITSYDLKVARSVEKIKITAKPKDSEAIVEINGSKVDSSDSYEREVDLDTGDNEIIIDVSNGRSKTKTYTLNIKRGGTTTEDDEDVKEDEKHLSDISLSDGEINFSKEIKEYHVNVNNTVNKIEVKAKPEDKDYKVKINGITVYEDEEYKTSIELKPGENVIEISVKDGTNENIYTLNVTRGDDDSTKASNINTNVKANQWIQINGVWQYNDSMGNSIKNSWFYDKNIGSNYYLQADGNMATGWLLNNGKWYYLGTDGAMKTGWILSQNKYYYLYSDGSMAYNTTINGYKLGADGAWIRK